MARKARVEFPGAINHVMDRGDRREEIFQDDVDRQDLLKTLAETCQRRGFAASADWTARAVGAASFPGSSRASVRAGMGSSSGAVGAVD